jgi:hypothetical protein
MVVVNTLGEPVTLVNSGGEPVTLFNPNGTLWDYPFSLFSNNEQGAWYDPSDFSTLYQTSTGTTPVTAVEQPVGLMLDRSRGLVLGSELYAGGVSTGTAGYANYTAGTATWEIFRDAGGVGSLAIVSSAPAFTTYLVTLTMAARGADSRAVDCRISSGTGGADFSSIGGAAGNYSFIVRTGNSVSNITLTMPNIGFGGLFTNISVKSLPGNHALQATSASRPVLRSRYNLLTYSEQFNDVAWTKQRTTVTANAVTAPDGTTTADTLLETADSGSHGTYQSISKAASSTTYALSFYVKPNGRTWTILQLDSAGEVNHIRVWFNLSGSGAVGSNASAGSGFSFVSASIQALADGWYRCTAVITSDTNASATAHLRTATGDTVVSYTGDITKGLYIWGAQLLTAADQTSTGGAYQRIAAATDYDVSNPVWRPYLAFDGVDDFFNLASAISITTDMTVVRGFGRSAAGIQSAGLGTSGAEAPAEMAWNTSNDIVIGRLGTPAATVTSANTTTGYYVSTNRRDATNEIGRLSGTQILTRASITVAGTLTDLGRRQTGTVYNSGPVYGLIVLDRALTGSELTATEQWMAGKTGAVLA